MSDDVVRLGPISCPSCGASGSRLQPDSNALAHVPMRAPSRELPICASSTSAASAADDLVNCGPRSLARESYGPTECTVTVGEAASMRPASDYRAVRWWATAPRLDEICARLSLASRGECA